MCHAYITPENKEYIHIKLPSDRWYAQAAYSSFFSSESYSSETRLLPSLYFDRISSFFRLPRSGGGEVLSKAMRVCSAGRSWRGRETWNKCEIKIEHDEAGKRPWKQAPYRPEALRPGRARRLANRCEKVQPRGSGQWPHSTYYQPSNRHPRVSICRLLFKLREGLCCASVLTPLSSRLAALTVFNSLLEVRLLPCEESCKRRAGAYIWEQSRSADTLHKAVGREECFCWVYFVACNCL